MVVTRCAGYRRHVTEKFMCHTWIAYGVRWCLHYENAASAHCYSVRPTASACAAPGGCGVPGRDDRWAYFQESTQWLARRSTVAIGASSQFSTTWVRQTGDHSSRLAPIPTS